MPAPPRRAGARPAAADLDELSAPPTRLVRAPKTDPVTALASPTPSQPPPAPVTRAPSAATKTKTGFYQDVDAAARARAAYTWTRAQEGHRTFSDLIARAVLTEVERLEAKYHDGQPWPGMQPGQIGTGKPLSA